MGCLCDQCSALCCRYFALEIDEPETRSQFDDVGWYLVHENVVVFVEKKQMQYLYPEGESFVFMDMVTYDQTPIHKDILGDRAQWLIPNIEAVVELYNSVIVNVNLPDTMTLQVTATDPVIKGQTATNQYKPATLENGAMVMVPPFIVIDRKSVV